MVLQTSEIADTPPTRRSRAARVPPDGLAGPIRVLGIGGPVLLALYMASMFLPMAFVIGGLRITPYAGLLIIFIGPMFLAFLNDRTNRFVALDFFMVAHVGWMALAVLYTEGLSRGVFVVNTALTSLGGYMIGRVLIRGPGDYERFFRYFFYGLLFYLPFAVLELLTKQVPVRDFLRLIAEVDFRPNNARVGLNRVQAFLEHPITYGMFCSIGVANLYYIYRGRWFKRASRTGTAVIMTLLSLSSAPTIALGIQFALISWDRMLKGVRHKWVGLLLIVAVTVSVLHLASPHGLVGLVIDNLSYESETGWARVEIFDYGSAEVMRHPFFGIGFAEWIRPFWRNSSVDNFWLVVAMRYGLPALFFLLGGLAIHAVRIMSRRDLSEEWAGLRMGYVAAWAGVVFVLATVHIWGTAYIFIMTYMGAGAWLYTTPTPPTRYRRIGEIRDSGAGVRAATGAGQTAETPPRRPARGTIPTGPRGGPESGPDSGAGKRHHPSGRAGLPRNPTGPRP